MMGFQEEFKIYTDKITDEKYNKYTYLYGSHLYGTNNSESDRDFIVILPNKMINNFEHRNYSFFKMDFHLYSFSEFQMMLDEQSIEALEIYSAYYMNLKGDFLYNINTEKLRSSISRIVSNSWVKGKKKLIVNADYDLNIALKSIFHSIRICDFGIQIARDGIISDYSKYNWLLDDLKKLSEQHQGIELWNTIDTKYRELYNSVRSRFKELCPKKPNDVQKRHKLKKIMKKYRMTQKDQDEIINMIFK